MIYSLENNFDCIHTIFHSEQVMSLLRLNDEIFASGGNDGNINYGKIQIIHVFKLFLAILQMYGG